MSPAKALLWRGLKGRQFHGRQFRRQHPVGPYLLDFYRHSLRLCIEVDGRWHEFEERVEADRQRDLYLQRHGVRTVRLNARAVLTDPDFVLGWLGEELGLTSPSVGSADTSPASQGRTDN